ncbi:hypothetical protein REPUB_Repub12eG0105900 [Reevesia pubescens]
MQMSHRDSYRLQTISHKSGHQNHKILMQRLEWRSRLHSVFVDNIRCRVSRNALWEAFNQYGRVVDVYLSPSVKQGKARSFTFAFVRYKHEHEALKAIMEGDRRKIDGCFIFVKKTNVRDGRSYKDVLVGFAPQKGDERSGDFDIEMEVCPGKVNEVYDDSAAKAVNFEIGLPKNDMDWLYRSAIGRPVGFLSFVDVQTVLKRKNINCLLALMGDVTVLATFRSNEEMISVLHDNKSLVDDIFKHIAPWDFSITQRQTVCLDYFGRSPSHSMA